MMKKIPLNTSFGVVSLQNVSGKYWKILSAKVAKQRVMLKSQKTSTITTDAVFDLMILLANLYLLSMQI